MKRLLLMCCIFLSGCAFSHLHEQINTDIEQAECLKKHDNVWTIASWVAETFGIQPNVCRRVHDVVIPVQVGKVAILLVDIEMPMSEWWHLNDVMMAYHYSVFQLSWHDVEQLDKPYYEQQLRKLLYGERMLYDKLSPNIIEIFNL